MWGAILAVVDLVCGATFLVILIRMAVVLRRHGMHLLSAGPLWSVPRADRRPVMRAIRRGEPVPPEYLGVARHWARRQVLTKGHLWIPIPAIPVFTSGLRGVLVDPGPLGQAGSWLMLVAMGMIVVATVLMWRDHRAAARLIRDTAPTA